MKKTNKVILSILALAATSGATLGVESLVDKSSDDEVLVTTKNGGEITKEEVLQDLYDTYGVYSVEQRLQEILLNENYSVTDKEIDAQLDTIKGSYSEDEWTQLLSAYGYESENDVRDEVKLSLLSQAASIDGITAKKADVESYYKGNIDSYTTVQYSQIIVSDLKTAKEIYSTLKDGADFETVAEKYVSEQNENGNLGVVPINTIDKSIAEVIFKNPITKENLYEPIETTTGEYAIVLASDMKTLDFENNYEQIELDYKLSIAKDEATVTNKLLDKSGVKYNNKELEKSIKEYLKQEK